MNIQEIDIELLCFDQNNLREHSDENIQMIKNSIKEHGQYKPLIVDKETMVVKAGNGRLHAMKQLGYQFVWCVLMEAGQDLAVMDNRLNELSEWNSDKQISQWLLDQKGLQWWGIDEQLNKQLTKKSKKKQNKNNLTSSNKEKLCPCCGNPLKKKERLVIV